VLHISNGTTINERLRQDSSCIARAVQASASWEQVLEEAFLKTLCRAPSEREQHELLAEFQSATDAERRVLLEDLYWSLMSSREFLFNH
jgi:hypothetical protein